MRHRSLLAWIAIAAVVVLSVFAGLYMLSNNDKATVPEGTYGIKDIEYLIPISSSTLGYFLEKNQGTTFTFYDDEFYIDASSSALNSSIPVQAFLEVTYKETPLGNTLNLTNGVNKGIDLSKFKKTRMFHIFSKNVDTGYAIYRLDDEIWLSYMAPNSKLKFAEYLFSLQVDELQNQSASEILSWLVAKNYPISETIIIDGENDKDGLLIPGGYISKAEWIDTRGVKAERCHVSVEVFQTRANCEQRKDYLEKFYSFMSSDGYNYFSEGSVLIAVQKGLTDQQAAIYGEALKAIKTVSKMTHLHQKNISLVEKTGKSKKNVMKLFQYLEMHPIIDINKASKDLEISFNTASSAVKKLVEIGILLQTEGMLRNRIFAYQEYLNILRRDTE